MFVLKDEEGHACGLVKLSKERLLFSRDELVVSTVTLSSAGAFMWLTMVDAGSLLESHVFASSRYLRSQVNVLSTLPLDSNLIAVSDQAPDDPLLDPAILKLRRLGLSQLLMQSW